MNGPRIGPMRLGADESIGRHKVKPGTVRRILSYASPYRWSLAVVILATAVDAAIVAAGPVLLKTIIDEGILRGRHGVVVAVAALIAGLAVLNALAIFTQTRFSSRVGQGIVFDLRCKVFGHVQRQPLAFFTRTQTGSLVSRLNTDVVGAQQAITTLLSQTVSTLLTLVFVLSTMFYLSWQITVAALVMIPLFLLPAKLIGRRLQTLTRTGMELNADLGSMMNERFNVSGALLAKLYGRTDQEQGDFSGKAARVRDVAVSTAVYGRLLFIITTLITGVTTAVVYGLGGVLTIGGEFQIGTLVAMATLLLRLYGPVNQLSNMHVSVMVALVSFDRVFEVLDLRPLVDERPGARPLPADAAPDVVFEGVSFGYPGADEVSIASLESVAHRQPERAGRPVLDEVSFTAPAGGMTALVGPSGAGKTTITQLVPRLYDATEGTVRVGGHDVRDLTLRSLTDAIGVVTQDAHMFHDTIRANLLYANPDATEEDLVGACEAARIWPTIAALPDGLDTVVGDRGYRLSGGEKQRVALARLLLKSPPIVVLDEATAHLDSESEAAIQRALKTALAGRTSLVVAHRLSTIHEADQILVLNGGRIEERGTHRELLAAGGLYAELYRTQFAADPSMNATSRATPSSISAGDR
nr:ABC transporter ATP-binding protein [Herbidospora solisilvae]